MSSGRLILGIFVILIGISVFIDIPIFKFVFAALVIGLGVKIMAGKGGGFFGNEDKGVTNEDEISRVMIFSGINRKFVSSDFKGGEVVAVFGGGEIDLSEAKTKQKNIEIEVVAVFGGMKIIVPNNWVVKSEGVGILGGFDSKVNTKEKGPAVLVKGAAIFGAVEIVSR